MIYDFIEVGTSNFNYLAGDDKYKIGLSIEPINYYLKQLPTSNSIHINKAVSDKIEKTTIYYTLDDSLPKWARGLGKVGTPHPQLTRLTQKNKSKIQSEQIITTTWEELDNVYQIEEVGFLKIDTEGHDWKILKSFFEYFSFSPQNIQVEILHLKSWEKKELEAKLQELGYNYYETRNDIVANL